MDQPTFGQKMPWEAVGKEGFQQKLVCGSRGRAPGSPSPVRWPFSIPGSSPPRGERGLGYSHNMKLGEPKWVPSWI